MCVSLSADGDASADSRRSRVRCRCTHPRLHRRQSIDGHRLSSHTEPRACLSSGVVDERPEYDDLEALLQIVLVSTRELPETTQVDRSERSYSEAMVATAFSETIVPVRTVPACVVYVCLFVFSSLLLLLLYGRGRECAMLNCCTERTNKMKLRMCISFLAAFRTDRVRLFFVSFHHDQFLFFFLDVVLRYLFTVFFFFYDSKRVPSSQMRCSRTTFISVQIVSCPPLFSSYLFVDLFFYLYLTSQDKQRNK